MTDVVDATADLWIVDPLRFARADLVARALSLLTPDERKKHDAFRFDVHRHEYLVTRATALAVLAAYVAAPPEALRFERNAFGCPRLVSHAGVDFNLTNATSMVGLLVSREGPVGVDLEPLTRADDILEVAETVFAPRELAELRALPTLEARRARGLDLWTLKESYIKARGMGLSLPLDKFRFQLDEGAPPRVHVDASLGDDGERWAFSCRDVAGHRVSTCVDRSRSATRGVRVRVASVVPFAAPVALDDLA